MKRHASTLAAVTALLAIRAAAAADFHVSPGGSDANPGTAEKPWATLEGARLSLRKLKDAAPLKEPVTVHMHGGTYFLTEPVRFGERDSGSEAAPIVYRVEPGATARMSGGKEVVGWGAVTNQAVLERLVPEARDKVVVADLTGQGVTNWGKLSVRGFGAGNPSAEAELFYQDEPMTLARWPNIGFRKVKSKDGEQLVIVDTDRVARWKEESDPWVFAYWHYDWAEICEPLAGVDAARQALRRTSEVKPVYGITPQEARWYGYNLLSEIDSPGEYYLDRTKGLLYFWPPTSGGRAVLSVATDLIQAENVSHVTFQGFVFEACRGTAISLRGGTNCHLVGCTVRNTGRQGVQVSQGARHEVFGCDVYYTGTGGISMDGGHRPTLSPAGHNAENNHVHHFSRRGRTYNPGISIGGVGNRMAHNLIHHGPHMGLSAGGNNHVVEFNEIHNVVQESGDAGAYYVGRDWTQRGNVLRHNFFHQIVGSAGFGGMTIYLDDQHCGHTIHGNIFERCSQTIFIGGGNDNVVTNNVFLDCWKSAHLDDRGMNWQKKDTDDPNGELRRYLRAMPYQNALWSQSYPNLVRILEDDPGVPKRNVYAGNISAGGIWHDIYPSIRRFQTVTNNLAFDDDKEWARLIKDDAGKPLRLEFKDPEAVARIGFTPIPAEKIGLYSDPRRASWPVQHEVNLVRLPEKARPPKQAGTAQATAAGWRKHRGNPVLGGNLGTCFDIAVLREDGRYRMWFSWRPQKSIALTESTNGVDWSKPLIVLRPNPETDWEEDINRPVVVRREDGYHLWYTGQARGKSWIGYASSVDGVVWHRRSQRPALAAEAPWEKVAVMCPHVLWNAESRVFQMWYSGGEQYEPDAIGYATSLDGLRWSKHPGNPVFKGDASLPWEHHKVTACQVLKEGAGYVMFYIGFRDMDHAQIGLARSPDGIGNWRRHPANPIISPTANAWDHDACYKPFAVFDGEQWLLWYNGRHGSVEQIGLATHRGRDLGF